MKYSLLVLHRNLCTAKLMNLLCWYLSGICGFSPKNKMSHKLVLVQLLKRKFPACSCGQPHQPIYTGVDCKYWRGGTSRKKWRIDHHRRPTRILFCSRRLNWGMWLSQYGGTSTPLRYILDLGRRWNWKSMGHQQWHRRSDCGWKEANKTIDKRKVDKTRKDN